MAVIVECQRSTEFFLEWELNYLLKYLHYNVTSQIPNIHNQMQNLYRKALIRFNAGTSIIEKKIVILNKKIFLSDDKNKSILILHFYKQLQDYYKTFIQRLTKQLIGYLTIDSNHSRRILSLNLLINIQTLLPSDEWLKYWTEDDVKNCHNILLDGYEKNRKMALSLLQQLPPEFLGFTVSFN